MSVGFITNAHLEESIAAGSGMLYLMKSAAG
jgi:hypothetical protein